MRKVIAILIFLVAAWIPTFARAEEDQANRVDRIKMMIAQHGTTDKEALQPASAASPEDGALGGNGLKVFEGLVLCVAVFCFGIFIYRKITGVQPVGRGRRLRMIERIALAPKTSLVLAEVDGREVVLAVGSEHVAFMDMEPLRFEEREYLCETENERLRTAS